MPKIDRRIKKTRQALKEAYIHLIETYSEEEITVSMIAQHADLNRTTFYAHYSNKEEFLEEAVDELLEEFRKAILEPFQIDTNINVQSQAPTTVQIFDYIEKNKRAFYALYLGHAQFKTRLQELFYSIFSEDILIELETMHGEINYDMFLHYQSNATLGLIFYWIQGDFKYTKEFMMEQLTILSNTQVVELKKIRF